MLTKLLPPYSTTVWKAIGTVVGLIIILALVLFTLHSCGNLWSSYDIGKSKKEVNAALEEVNAAKGTVANDRVDEAVALEKVKEAANNVITASNATDEAKTAANQALANYNAAVSANRPVGTTGEDLKRKLEALGQ